MNNKAWNKKCNIESIHFLSLKPLIIICLDSVFDVHPEFFEGISKMKEKAYVLCIQSWYVSDFMRIRYAKIKKACPNIEFTYLCNTFDESKLAELLDLPATYLNQNAFLDENIYFPMAHIEKKYDAIYNARFAPYKRHYLATDIQNLALLGYGLEDISEHRRFSQTIKRLLPHAHYLNFKGTDFTWIDPRTIPHHLNQARIGLCLSAVEGAMYASAEYLLCGLPVVSTRSFGGRDVLYDDEYVRIVDDNPKSVANAVAELIQLNIPPDYIYRKTLEKMAPHRDKFNEVLKEIFLKEKVEPQSEGGWFGKFTNKMAVDYLYGEIEAGLQQFDEIEKAALQPFEVLPWNGYTAAISFALLDDIHHEIDEPHYLLDSVLPEFSKRNLPTSIYLNADGPDRIEEWKALLASGHQIGGISFHYLEDHVLTFEKERREIQESKQLLEKKFGSSVFTYAYPRKKLSSELKKWLPREYLMAIDGRAHHPWFALGVFVDWFDLPVFKAEALFTFFEYKNTLQRNIAQKGWIILESKSSVEPISEKTLIQLLDYVQQVQDVLWVAPVGEVGAYMQAKRIVESAHADDNNNKSIFTWKKPKIFPAGIQLQLKLRDSQKAISQGGEILHSDNNGVFTLSFDAQEMCLYEG